MVEHIDTLCWAVMLALFIGIEAATPQLVSVWFAAGSLCAGIVSLFTGSISVQIIVFLAVSAVCLVFTRPMAARLTKAQPTPTNADMVIGKIALVTEATNPATGTARAVVMGESWSVACEDGTPLSVGQNVQVCKISGVKLMVQAVK